MQGFLRRRLRITGPYDADEVKDAIPITLDALEQWAAGDHRRRPCSAAPTQTPSARRSGRAGRCRPGRWARVSSTASSPRSGLSCSAR
ncbi:hypothetical protein [Nocardioides sp. B-3]|uniref:hypothetical protein n=1 Tax=Nocardioides sp. B-3 TaxID=2895565 RepID=UPI00300DCAF4